MALENLIFDFFGTLVKYDPLLVGERGRSAHRLLIKEGYYLEYNQFIESYDRIFDRQESAARLSNREFHIYETFSALFSELALGELPQGLVASLANLFMDDWHRGIIYLEGIESFIHTLASQYRLSIISNIHYPPLIHYHLQKMGVARYFEQVVTSAELGIRKPSPQIFRYALGKLNVKGKNSLYIGDNYRDDYPGAVGAGMQCCIIGKEGQLASLFDLNRFLETQ